MDIYNIDELGPATGTVFQIFANNNLETKINTLFDTGAMKSVMSLEMYKKLNLNDLDTSGIPHVVGASGESLGARGRTKCEININGKIFYQSFIVCEHLKRPIILGRDFSIQNCIGISWTKSKTHQLTQNNEVIAETTEYQTSSCCIIRSTNPCRITRNEEQTKYVLCTLKNIYSSRCSHIAVHGSALYCTVHGIDLK